MAKVTFVNSNNEFFQSLKKSVEEYFRSHHLKKTGNWKLYLKAAVLIPSAFFLYIVLLSGSYHPIAGMAISVFLGIVIAMIGFNVMHDACHGSYSEHKWINEIVGVLSMNSIGSNAFIWKLKHNIIHHTYTNVDGVDDDIAKSPVLRHCPTQKWLPMHRYQFVYMFLLYCLSSFFWIMVVDFIKYFSRKVYTTPLRNMNAREHFIFWISKVLYVLFYAIVPIYMVGWLPWIAGFMLMHAGTGLTLGVVFQLAHVVEKTAFEEAGEEPKIIESEWAVYQLKTTSNFAMHNKVVCWMVGGLNFQIEHHLFPRVSHVHYPAISKIVQEACQKYKLNYNYYPSMLQAVVSHVKTMKRLGKKDWQFPAPAVESHFTQKGKPAKPQSL